MEEERHGQSFWRFSLRWVVVLSNKSSRLSSRVEVIGDIDVSSINRGTSSSRELLISGKYKFKFPLSMIILIGVCLFFL